MKLWTGVAAMLFAAGTVWAQDEAGAELGKAGAKAQEWKSYTFKSTSKTEGMPQRQNGGGGQDPAAPRTSEGEYVADKGLHTKMGETEIIRKGEKTAIKGRDGKWAAPQQGGDQQGRQRGRGQMGSMPPPHEAFKDLDKNFKKIEKSTDGDLALYSGELTAEGVSKMSGRGGRGGQGGGTMESSGTAKVWVDANGNIVKIETKTQMKGKMREQDVDIKTERTVEFSKFDESDFEIPEEAKKIFTD